MPPTISTELLLRLLSATPEQYAAVERVLGVTAECGMRSGECGLENIQFLRNPSPPAPLPIRLGEGGVGASEAERGITDAECGVSSVQCSEDVALPDRVSHVLEGLRREFVVSQKENRAGFEKLALDMKAVAAGNYELRQENDELRRLHAEGYFKFAVKVDAADFQAFAVIIALGNRKAAAEHLKIPHRSFYDRVDKWEARGREYQLMSRFIEWRKRSSRHIEVRLDESLQSGESGGRAENPETLRAVLEEVNASEGANYPDLLADIFGALQRQNAANWSKVRDEVVNLIKEDLPQ